jgi:hypothetical protein
MKVFAGEDRDDGQRYEIGGDERKRHGLQCL